MELSEQIMGSWALRIFTQNFPFLASWYLNSNIVLFASEKSLVRFIFLPFISLVNSNCSRGMKEYFEGRAWDFTQGREGTWPSLRTGGGRVGGSV